jgi:hydrogenase assembly chaperone HypC/HupF
MCLAIPGKVTKITGLKAWVEYPGETRPALVADEGIRVGDYVLVQMGIIVKVLNAQEIASARRAWERN